MGLVTPNVLGQKKKAAFVTAISHNKNLGIALFEFETDYGSLPSPSTVSLINTKFPNHGHDLSGNSSNAIFRQIFIAGIIDTEKLFFAKIPGAKKADNNIDPGHLLEKGEVAFAYISGHSQETSPSASVLLCPLIPGTTKFDPEPFEGQAAILHLDQSVSAYKIENDGHVYLDGIDILSPNHPIWDGKPPTIHYPEL